MKVEAHPDTTVLATTTLPWSSPDPSRFSSIHSDPPWQPTDHPELVLHRCGQGRALYSSGVLENVDAFGEPSTPAVCAAVGAQLGPDG